MDLTDILEQSVRMGCSDVIITAGSRVLYRVDGHMNTREDDEILEPEKIKRLCYGIVNADQVARFEREKELDFSFHCPIGDDGGAVRVRGNYFYQRKSIGAVFRLISTRIPTIGELGLPAIVAELAMSPHGLVLVTGPTGHGKSTTLAAMIHVINQCRDAHIVTIEDPLEYYHSNLKSVVQQREVGDDTKSFATALRHVLRQAPDVILIGEMRDAETMQAGITAAETGHLVFASLHTNDSIQTIDRIIDTFPAAQQPQIRSQLSMSLKAVLSQRLIPRIDGEGRALAFEILLNTPAIAHLIRDKKTHQAYGIMETSAKDGMVTLDASLLRLLYARIISPENCRSLLRNPNVMDRSAVGAVSAVGAPPPKPREAAPPRPETGRPPVRLPPSDGDPRRRPPPRPANG